MIIKPRFLCFCAVFLVTAVTVYSNPFMAPPPDDTQTTVSPRFMPAPVRPGSTDPVYNARQRSVREKLADAFRRFDETGDTGLLWGLLSVSFLYGLLHAAGPGHRKTILFSLYLARKAPVWEPAASGLLLSYLHGGSAVVLILVYRSVSGAISAHTSLAGVYMEGFSYILLILLSVYLVIRVIMELAGNRHGGDKKTTRLGAVLLSGLYPCPGAILVLILSVTLNMTGTGILSVLAMSTGMSLPVIATGYLAWFGRTGLFFSLRRQESRMLVLSSGIELIGYILLLVFSVYTAMPFIVSLFALLNV